MNGIFNMLDAFKRSPWASALLLFLLSLFGLQINLGHQPVFDEIYHVLAAQGWLEHGEPRIAEGSYERVLGFTILIAWLFDLFGVSLEVGRQPAVIACALLVALVFCWSWYQIGRTAAWMIAILFATSPFLIDIAQFVRFYALQALAFWIGAMSIYALLGHERSLGQRLILAFGAVVALMLAYYFQPVTIIGAFGLCIWAALVLCIAWLRDAGPARSTRLVILFGLALVGMAAAAFVLTSDVGSDLINKFNRVPVWGQANRGSFFYYHAWLVLYYPSLWTLIPVLVLVAVVSKPRPAWFAFTIFIVAFLIHSFAAAKGLRYIFYAIPFLFILWGIALADLFGRLVGFVQDYLDRASKPVTAQLADVLRPIFWVVFVGFTLSANTATVRSVTMLAGITIPPERPPLRWGEVRPVLQPWLDSADVVITSSEMHALYYLGRYDLLFSQSRFGEIEGEQLARDYRTGRPVINDRALLMSIIECYPKGLIVSTALRWRSEWAIDIATANEIVRHTEMIDLPKGSGVVAFGWDHEVASDNLLNCPTW